MTKLTVMTKRPNVAPLDKGEGLIEVAPGKFMAPGSPQNLTDAIRDSFSENNGALRRLAQ